jgi:DNA helicase-2/ATP-dependent DNA helicase PcrA
VIYGYAGADPGYLIDYRDLFPGATELALDTNYRCAPDIVEATTHLLGYNRRRIDKTINAARANEDIDAGLAVVRAPGDDLAVRAADTIKQWVDSGVSPSSIAVLTRVNSSLIPVKAALQAAGVPTNDLLGPDSLNRTAVRALFSWIRLSLDPEDMATSDVIEAVRRPSRGLTTIARDVLTQRRTSLIDLALVSERLDHKQADRWHDFVEQLEGAIDLADEGDAAALVRHLTDDAGLSSAAQTLDSARTSAARSSHSDDLAAIRRAAALHPDATTLVHWLNDIVATPSAPDGVTLSSIHRVKGMEWPRVVVFGADRGSMPHELSTDREEERRVFHVAITRAMDHVLVLSDKSRPSRFIDELDGSAKAEPERPTIPSARREVAPIATGPTIDDRVTLRGGLKGVVTARSENSIEVRMSTGAEIVAAIADIVAVDRPSSRAGDPAIVEALKEWRRTKSTELGVPAYIVLHDATIDELAERLPTSERELSRISGIGSSKIEHYGDEILAITNV